MVTLREGRDPDELPSLEDIPEPNYFKTKLVLSVLWAMFSAVIAIPAAGVTFLSVYTASTFAQRLGVSTGWATYWYSVTAMLVVTPLKAFEFLCVPDDFQSSLIPDDA